MHHQRSQPAQKEMRSDVALTVAPPPEGQRLVLIGELLEVVGRCDLLGVEVVRPVPLVALVWSKRRVRERGARVNEAA